MNFQRNTTRRLLLRCIVELGERLEKEPLAYEKNIAKYVMMPANAIRRHPFVEERTGKLAQYAESCAFNRVEMGETRLGIITSSTSYQYVKEVFGDQASILKLGMIYPLPEKLILDFAAKVDKLAIVEELDPIIEDHCKKLGLAVTGKEVLPMEGENLERNCRHIRVWKKVFPDARPLCVQDVRIEDCFTYYLRINVPFSVISGVIHSVR